MTTRQHTEYAKLPPGLPPDTWAELLILQPVHFLVYIRTLDEWEEVKKLAGRRAPRHAYLIAGLVTRNAPPEAQE